MHKYLTAWKIFQLEINDNYNEKQLEKQKKNTSKYIKE